MNELDLAAPQRQSIIGVAVIFFKNLRIAFNVFLSLILVQFGLKFSFLGFGLNDLAIILGVIFLIVSYLQYRRFFFYVVDDNFIIEKGLLSRDKITIPFDRIQTVNITQNLIQQILKVVALKLDTAGSAQEELEISALKGAYARELQKFLIDKKRELVVEKDVEHDTGESATADDQNSDEPLIPLVSLSIKKLLLVGLTENHLRTGLVVFAVLNGYFWQYEEYLLKPLEPFIEEKADYLLTQWLILVPFFVIVFLVVATLISLIQVLLRYYNLRFFVDAKGVQLTSGLLKRNEFQVPVKKIQYLRWTSNPLRKLLGIKTLVVKKATSEVAGDKQGIKVPGCSDDQIARVFDQFFPERKEGDFVWYRAHKLLFLQLSIYLGLVPALALLFLVFIGKVWVILSMVFLPLALFFIYRYYQSVSLAVNRDIVVLQKGWVYPSYQLFKLGKLQDATLTQSIFQKRRGLATLSFHTAAGSARMPHLPHAYALEIYNYTLLKIQTFKGGWM